MVVKFVARLIVQYAYYSGGQSGTQTRWVARGKTYAILQRFAEQTR